MRAQVIDALQRVGMPAEMSRRPAGAYSGGCVSTCSQTIATASTHRHVHAHCVEGVTVEGCHVLHC